MFGFSTFVPQSFSDGFPVSDELLLSIWEKRSDLQRVYPEVEDGNLNRLKTWAKLYGWQDQKSLAILTPEGKIPMYDNPYYVHPIVIPGNAGDEKYVPIILIIFVLGIGTAFSVYISYKKIKQKINS